MGYGLLVTLEPANCVVRLIMRTSGGQGRPYEFIVDFDAAQDDADSARADKIHPFFLVGGIYVHSVVAGEVYSGCFGVSDVGDVVYMAWTMSMILLWNWSSGEGGGVCTLFIVLALCIKQKGRGQFCLLLTIVS